MLKFKVVGHWDKTKPRKGEVLLRSDTWDDFGFKTLYEVSIGPLGESSKPVILGNVKVIRKGKNKGPTDLPDEFTELGDGYCSLGQSSDYYEKLYTLPDLERICFLNAMKDVTFDSEVKESFKSHPAWETSLLRFGEADNALKVGELLSQGQKKQRGIANFTFNWAHHDEESAVSFNFNDGSPLPGRFNAIVGYNGSGKTSLLADLAMTISRSNVESRSEIRSELKGEDATFASVIAISYSAFDKFDTPASLESSSEVHGDFGYTYCGLRKIGPKSNDTESSQLKSIDEIESDFAESLTISGNRSSSREHLVSAFRVLAREPSFGRIGVDLRNLEKNLSKREVREDFSKLSTGHKIVVNIVTQLAARLRNRSIVLIDEPETHLHPPLVAALLKAIQTLLEYTDSFCILATHSPVILQEIPSEFVKVVDRIDSHTTFQLPDIETFGESIGNITRFIFSLDSSSTDYQGILRSLSKDYSSEELLSLFPLGMSAQARSLFANYRK